MSPLEVSVFGVFAHLGTWGTVYVHEFLGAQSMTMGT